MKMDFDLQEPLSADYSDFGEEFERLMAMEIADASIARGRTAENETASSLLDAVQAYLDNVECGVEKKPSEIGEIEGYGRKSIIDAALTLAVAKAIRRCRRRSPSAIAMLLYVAFRSDNEHGRCTDSASRQADFIGCAEDVVRDLRDELVKCGSLRVQSRPGHPAALWLPYPTAAAENSAHSILLAMAPARPAAGRPRKSEASDPPQKTSGISYPTISMEQPPGITYPTISEKGRVFAGKRSGVENEKVGHLTPDCKNSLQDLNTRTHSEESVSANEGSHAPETLLLVFDEGGPRKRKARATGKRPWEWVHESERERLGEICKAYALERSWPTGHLRDRLVAFDNHQRIHKSVSADWEASLLQWLGDPRFQPRTSRGAGRKGFAEIAAEQFGLDGDL